MRILLDTHALLWWLDGDVRLSRRARAAIGDVRTTCLVSAASAWEITTKARLGKLPGAHRDPFDRMLIAQSQAENLPLVSNDAVFDTYGIVRIW